MVARTTYAGTERAAKLRARNRSSSVERAVGYCHDWVFRFQQLKFLETLPEKHKATFESMLAPIINNNFNFGKAAGSGPAFAQMTAQVFEEVGRNTERLPQLEAPDVPVKMVWGDTDLALNTGVAKDLQSHLKNAALHVLSAGHWPQIDEPDQVAKVMLS